MNENTSLINTTKSILKYAKNLCEHPVLPCFPLLFPAKKKKSSEVGDLAKVLRSPSGSVFSSSLRAELLR